MELTSEQRINAPREQVFAALNDTEILRQCIPGCERLNRDSDTEMSATVVLRIGPVKAKFNGRVELSNLVPPESYSISGQGSGGAAGFAKGGADVKLLEDGSGTRLQYQVTADVGGRFAQLGSRLVDSTAKTLSAKFFERFRELVEGDQVVESKADNTTPDTVLASSGGISRAKIWLWVGAGIAVLAALIAIAHAVTGNPR